MRKLFSLILALMFASFIVSCGGGEETAEETEEPMAEKPSEMAAPSGYMAMDVTNGGTITGKVTFAGQIPPKVKLEVTKDVNVCGKVDHYKKDVVVSQDKGLANVVVKLSNISEGKAISAMGESFELDQNGCTFVPHVTLVPVGESLTILNSDGILHNIHTYSDKNPPINKAQPGFKKKMTETFEKPEIIRVACDVHNWMGGYIAVADHPYHVVTDKSGNFTITDVPAGTYTVEYWQETLGTKTAEVTVPAGGEADASLEYAPSSAQADMGAQELASSN
ncbi:hypothetical protein GWO43_13055 [candidate division KSB1 bacterium]|nr:hypothetical protein [candidate division KSB1 bacterium]NIR71647.1 hypothetical protein [candidate division KSB1 bacterium]NIS25099.1 hypothetical protein [candidate division KSB1 bacterium]NIT71784.1 hypothetical protein [candidate division KSB1 bacterium]NIU25798.1 hypothetical protein [candidate division KSB1 bacterium]